MKDDDSFWNHARVEQQRLNRSMERIQEILSKKMRNTLYSKEFILRHSDCDLNGHYTQSAYIRLFDDALCLYDDSYFDGKTAIKQFTLIYTKEMMVDRQKQSMCTVKICKDHKFKNEQEIIATMEQNNEICCKIRTVLTHITKENNSKL